MNSLHMTMMSKDVASSDKSDMGIDNRNVDIRKPCGPIFSIATCAGFADQLRLTHYNSESKQR